VIPKNKNQTPNIVNIDERIVKFINRHHVLTLATATTVGEPYCANAFYAYDAEHNRFIFTSDDATRHVQDMLTNSRVAASVVLETRIVGKVRSLHTYGTAMRGDETDRKAYLRRFPYAAAVEELHLW
jgi:uncharacterized protein YhbP (UPF0306 family)